MSRVIFFRLFYCEFLWLKKNTTKVTQGFYRVHRVVSIQILFLCSLWISTLSTLWFPALTFDFFLHLD